MRQPEVLFAVRLELYRGSRQQRLDLDQRFAEFVVLGQQVEDLLPQALQLLFLFRGEFLGGRLAHVRLSFRGFLGGDGVDCLLHFSFLSDRCGHLFLPLAELCFRPVSQVASTLISRCVVNRDSSFPFPTVAVCFLPIWATSLRSLLL